MFNLQEETAALFATGKGLLAADESNTSADKRLASFGIETGTEMHRKFRNMLLAAPGIEEYLSGVILYEETLDQKANDGTPFPELLAKHGIVPGIKVDQGLEPFPESKDESITNGLIGLPERLRDFKSKHNTGFTKWRVAIKIDGTRLPTALMLVENSKRLASYASEVQKACMVPIIEPEVLLDGNHSRMRCREVIEEALKTAFAACEDQAVDLSGLILKSSMALSGKATGKMDSPEEVAEDTIGAFMATVPPSVGGIVFLSGGQTPDQAINNLRAIMKKAKEVNAPWPITFSYSRAFQEEALAIWKGDDANVPAARDAMLARLKQASEALAG
jgi:fructose-bisphosphate aldolase class I